MQKIYSKMFKNTFTTILTVAISVLAIVGIVTAATTISANINTGGTLDVTGVATFDHATTTSATSTDYVYIGVDGTEDYFDFQGGDLYVQGDTEIEANLYVGGHASSTSATTTAYLYVGADGTENFFNFESGDLYVQDDAEIDSDLMVAGKATTSVAVTIGAPTANNIDFAGGDLIVQGDAELDGTTFMDHASTTSATTTDYLYVGYDGTEPSVWDFSGGDLYVGDDTYLGSSVTTSANVVLGGTAIAADATTTITFGSYGSPDKAGLCLKFHTAGVTIYCYLKTMIGAAETSTPFWCSTTACD